jgi:hypothetical protein
MRFTTRKRKNYGGIFGKLVLIGAMKMGSM